jgi:hypothetical protein
MATFTSNPSQVPFSNVIFQEWSAQTTSFGGGFSSTFEVTLCEWNFSILVTLQGTPSMQKLQWLCMSISRVFYR